MDVDAKKIRRESWMWMFFGFLIAGGAIRWFLSGEGADATIFWNIGIIAQFGGGIALAVYGWRRSKRLQRSAEAQSSKAEEPNNPT